ncbi:DUF2971 domain-containing protein [Vibrio splendidus]|nr:DUF2971 domain-containing protein [Vibrio splendidus]
MDVTVGESASEEESLWRYMSLDKLINLLETNELYFTALGSYNESDPFEGYMPDVAARAYSEIFGSQVNELKQAYESLKQIEGAQSNPKLDEMRDGIEKLSSIMELAFHDISKGITVNCWHSNRIESEAMWKLYSDDGKGIAVKTSVERLRNALKDQVFGKKIQIGKVKYLDFSDTNLTPRCCVVDGHISPLIKRSSFSHENELRCFIVNQVPSANIEHYHPSADTVPVDLNELIETIYISPFAKEPFISSVFAICRKYEIEDKVIKSTLLDSSSFLSKLSDW